MYKDLYLKFESQEQAEQLLFDVVDGNKNPKFTNTDVIGSIFNTVNSVIATNTGNLTAFPQSTSTLYIGSRSSDLKMSGTIKRIAYYPKRLSNAELQGITLP